MKLPEPVKTTIRAFAAKYPLATTDEASRVWTHQLCEQLAFTYPADGWGHKSAGAGRPHSADAIALRQPFICWDIILLSGSPAAELSLDGEHLDISGQVFEAVVPTNHLGTTPPPDPGPDPALERRVRRLEDDVARIELAIRDACEALSRV